MNEPRRQVIICPGCELPLPECECDAHPPLRPSKAEAVVPVANMNPEPGETVLWIRRNKEKQVIDRMHVEVLEVIDKKVRIKAPVHKKPQLVYRHNIQRLV